MTLKDLIKWALNQNISIDSELYTPNGKVTMLSRNVDKIILNDTSVSFKIIEVIQQTGCTRQQAELYLANNNWNTPLAIVSYQRDKEIIPDA